MRFQQESNPANYAIHAYQDGNVEIRTPREHAQQPASRRLTLTRSFIMTPQRLIQDWEPRSVSYLEAGHFDQIVDLNPEIILLGTGRQLQFPDLAVTRIALEKGIGVESMDSSAACRTFNILMYEGRQIAVAIML